MTTENKYILSINPGSTSTKVALYENEKELYKKSIAHDADELKKYPNVIDQSSMRYNQIIEFLNEVKFDMSKLSIVVGRGGMLPPVQSGAYEVNDVMIDFIENKCTHNHASNLGAVLADKVAKQVGIKALIYDPVSVDQMEDIARISGIKEIKRASFSHALNMRAMAIKAANEEHKKYEDLNIVVTHLGGGISSSVHNHGKMVDVISDDEGTFSPERSGALPAKALVELCFSGKYDKKQILKMLRGNGGLMSYLETTDAIQVEKMIENGDDSAKLVYEAMAYQVAKDIGKLATVVKGKVDFIILTGGIAYSKMLTDWIKERVEFIAPIKMMPGENELQSLAMGALRILNNEENARTFTY